MPLMKSLPDSATQKSYTNAKNKLEKALTVEYFYKYNFHSISLLFYGD